MVENVINRITAKPNASVADADAFAELAAAPPFNVKQPDYLPEGFKLFAQRYNPGPPDAQTGQGGVGVTVKEVRPQPAGPAAQEAVEQDRGTEPYILLVYEAPDGQLVQLFERAAQPGEALPAGEPRTVGGQPATLQRDGQTLKLTWIDAGTWIDLEGMVSEAELLRIAEELVTTQTPDSIADGGAGEVSPVIVPTSDKPVPAATVSALLDRPYCNPEHRVSRGLLLGRVEGQQHIGSIRISVMDSKYPVPESVSYAAGVKNVRDEVFAPALAALQDPSVSMQRLPYPSLSFKLSEAKGCFEPDPRELGYVVIEVWDDQVNVGYGGEGAALKERAVRALEQALQKGR